MLRLPFYIVIALFGEFAGLSCQCIVGLAVRLRRINPIISYLGEDPRPWSDAPANLLRTFLFNETATTEIYTLSLHDALPIWGSRRRPLHPDPDPGPDRHPRTRDRRPGADRADRAGRRARQHLAQGQSVLDRPLDRRPR